MTQDCKISTCLEIIDSLEGDVLALEMEAHELKQQKKIYEFDRYKLNTIQHLGRSGIWELNHLTYDLLISDELSYLLCKKGTDISGLSWNDFINTMLTAEDKHIKKELEENVIQNGESLDRAHYLKRFDGQVMYVHHHCKTFYNAIGQPLITVGLIRDITYEHNLSVELEKRSFTDELTQLFNRRRLNEIVKEQAENFLRYQNSSSYIMLDIDHFKNFNDLYGHQVGDEVLCKIAEYIKNNIRSIDYAGRWGGEEFLIICPSTPLKKAKLLAEKLRKGFVKIKISTKIKIAASFGVAEIVDGESTDALLKRVDDALYEAKELGRNQVRVSKNPAL